MVVPAPLFTMFPAPVKLVILKFDWPLTSSVAPAAIFVPAAKVADKILPRLALPATKVPPSMAKDSLTDTIPLDAAKLILPVSEDVPKCVTPACLIA